MHFIVLAKPRNPPFVVFVSTVQVKKARSSQFRLQLSADHVAIVIGGTGSDSSVKDPVQDMSPSWYNVSPREKTAPEAKLILIDFVPTLSLIQFDMIDSFD